MIDPVKTDKFGAPWAFFCTSSVDYLVEDGIVFDKIVELFAMDRRMDFIDFVDFIKGSSRRFQESVFGSGVYAHRFPGFWRRRSCFHSAFLALL